MFSTLMKKVFGSQADRQYNKATAQIQEINRFAADFEKVAPEELQKKTAEFRALIEQRVSEPRQRLGELDGRLRGNLEPEEREQLNDELDALEQEARRIEAEALEEIMPRAFALVKEACQRLLGQQWDIVGRVEEWYMVPYDVQLYGAVVLHRGNLAWQGTIAGSTQAVFTEHYHALTRGGTRSS